MVGYSFNVIFLAPESEIENSFKIILVFISYQYYFLNKIPLVHQVLSLLTPLAHFNRNVIFNPHISSHLLLHFTHYTFKFFNLDDLNVLKKNL